MLDINFNACTVFPELCGINTTWNVPAFKGTGAVEKKAGSGFVYTCKATMYATGKQFYSGVMAATGLYGIQLEDDKVFEHSIVTGGVKFADKNSAVTGPIFATAPQVTASVKTPALDRYFTAAGNSETAELEKNLAGFEKEEPYTYDLINEFFSQYTIDATTNKEAITSVGLGYRIPKDTTEEILLGILLNTELPSTELVKEKTKITQWAKFQLIDFESGQPQGPANAVTCTTIFGLPTRT